jgi:hypothetical protein
MSLTSKTQNDTVVGKSILAYVLIERGGWCYNMMAITFGVNYRHIVLSRRPRT